MMHRVIVLGFMMLFAGILLPRPVTAQAPPRSISALAGVSSLNAEELDRISQYAEYWANVLTDGSTPPTRIREAQDKLVDPLRGSGVTHDFRRHYGSSLVPPLREAVEDSQNAFCVVNAIIVISRIGTERALSTLIRRCNTLVEPDRTTRLSAARGVKHLLADDHDMVSGRAITQTVRRIRESIAKEHDPDVLRYLLDALLAADRNDLEVDNRIALYRSLSEGLKLAAGLGGDNPALLTASSTVVFEFLRIFLELDPVLQRNVSHDTGPAFIHLLSAMDTAWERVEDPAHRLSIGNHIGRLERLLSSMAAAMNARDRAPEADRMMEAWNTRERDAYNRILDTWKQLFG